MEYKFLEGIKTPDDLKKLNISELNSLCAEIRDLLINTVSKNGGHLASNLGAVELTVAIHSVLNAPDDSIIFDVGHQCYTHKLITGRYSDFGSIRKENGLSGFMRPDESIYDPFVTGHASNSLAAAYGIYKANVLKGKNHTSLAVIGDGSMTGGLALEALNNIGGSKGNFIVVLNDNKMSISKNVGSMSTHLKRIRLKPGYYRFKSGTENLLFKIPLIGKPIHSGLSRLKKMFTRQVYRNNLFECLGFKYIGPVDGHNIEQLRAALKIARDQSKPCVIHAITVKGKGYPFAEQQPGSYHGVSAFDSHDGIHENGEACFSSVAGETLVKLAENDKSVCAITAAMTTGTGLTEFSKRYKNRFFDVGIAEEYAATFAAGLASAGMKPYFAVYSSFLQRSYDQIIHDTAIAGLPVRYLIDRAGIVGEDGETHQGLFDVAFLTTIPKMTVYSPASYKELVGCIEKSATAESPLAIRYPRGKEKYSFEYSDKDFTVFSNRGRIALVTYGIISSNALEAQQQLLTEGVAADVIKLNKIYPISDKFCDILSDYDKVFFFEEGIRKGGISEHIVSRANIKSHKIIAIPDRFVPAMSCEAARKKYLLDSESMAKTVKGE